MKKSDRKKWPVSNTDELARHVAKALPELTRRQVMGVLNVAMHAILDSLGEQAAQGTETPTVKIREIGVFELRWYQGSTRPNLSGGLQKVPPRWRMAFRPSKKWDPKLSSWSARTRTMPHDTPPRNAPQEAEWSAAKSEQGTSAVPNMPAGDPSRNDGN